MRYDGTCESGKGSELHKFAVGVRELELIAQMAEDWIARTPRTFENSGMRARLRNFCQIIRPIVPITRTGRHPFIEENAIEYTDYKGDTYVRDEKMNWHLRPAPHVCKNPPTECHPNDEGHIGCYEDHK